MIVDTGVLIEVLRGKEQTKAWLESRSRGPLRYSPVTRAEIRAGARPRERAAISALFAGMDALVIDEGTADLAGDQLARHAASHGVQMGDALIAASALEHGDELATFNARHFPGVKRLLRPDR